MEFNWKKELQAPELTNDFKWRFAVDNLKPKMEIEGPSVGSLLYAMNPKTSELGLKQMDSELNQQLAANSNFDKRGDAAMRFMEQRVAEDIAAKQFADKMDMERAKAQNVDAGHVNSLLANYTDALSKGLYSAEIIEDQIRKTIPNADAIIAQGKEIAAKNQAQNQNYIALDSSLPRGNHFANAAERKLKLDEIGEAEKNGSITQNQASELRKSANAIPDRKTTATMKTIDAFNTNAANKSVQSANVDAKKKWIEDYKKIEPGKSDYYYEQKYEKTHKE